MGANRHSADNCPTWWRGCNCADVIDNLSAEVNRLSGLLRTHCPHKNTRVFESFLLCVDCGWRHDRRMRPLTYTANTEVPDGNGGRMLAPVTDKP